MIFRFDKYCLDTDQRTLLCDGVPVALTPKVFQTLTVLVEHRERVISKDELCRLIWPDQFVEESNLTQNISMLRRVLDETHTGKKYIATFHGHGYRFLEPVRVAAPDSASDPDPQPAPAMANAAVPAQQPVAETPPTRSSRPAPWVAGAAAAAVLLTAGLGWRKMHHKPEIDPVELGSSSTLTRLQGTQFEPAWSPDGRSFAFVNMLSDPQKALLYVQSEADLQPRLIASVAGELNSPAWSPDGKSLAFLRIVKDRAAIVIFDLATGKSRDLASLFGHRYGLDYRHLAWSPQQELLVVDDKAKETDPLSLYLVHLSNGQKSRLTYPTMDIIGDVAPRFSPTGDSVAFVRITYQGQNNVDVVPVTGGEATKVTDVATRISDVDWESDRELIFTGRWDDQFRFWHKSLDRMQSRPALVVRSGSDLPIQFSFDRKSRRLAYSAYSPNLDIWSVDTEGAKSWTALIATPGQDVGPEFSPDGSKIAFRSDVAGTEQLWVSDVNGANAHVVDTPGMTPAVHAWSADSQTLYFQNRATLGLYQVPASGNGRVTVLTSDHMSHAAPSIDGKTIFARSGQFVYRLTLATGNVEELTDQGGAPIVESSDGRYIYFSTGRMESKICRLDLRTKQQEVILSSLMPGYGESWALTTAGIYFLKEIKGQPTISFHDLSSGKESTVSVFQGDPPPVGESEFAADPSGHRLLVVRAEPVASSVEEMTLAQQPTH